MRRIRLLAGITLGLAMLLAPQAEAQDINVRSVQSVVLGERPIYRSETVAKGLPHNSDLKIRLQESDGFSYKVRGQLLPLETGKLSFGLAGKVTGDEYGSPEFDLGLAGRYDADWGKMAGRYYPASNEAHTKTVVKWDGVTTDTTITYDFDEGEGALRQGVDYWLNARFALGVEGKLHEDSEKSYIGTRLRFSF